MADRWMHFSGTLINQDRLERVYKKGKYAIWFNLMSGSTTEVSFEEEAARDEAFDWLMAELKDL